MKTRLNMRISHRIALIICLGLFGMAIMGVSAFLVVQKQADVMNGITRHNVIPLNNCRIIQKTFREIEYRIAGVLGDLVATVGSAEHLKLALPVIEERWGEVKAQLLTDDQKKLAKSFDGALSEFNALSDKLLAAYDDDDMEAVEAAHDHWLDIKPKIRNSLDSLADHLQTAVQNEAEKSRLNAEKTLRFGAAMLAGICSVFFAAAFLIYKSIKNPLAKLSEWSKAVAQGNIGKDLFISSSDEIGESAAALNLMLRNIRKIIGSLNKTSTLLDSHALKTAKTAQDCCGLSEQQMGRTQQVAVTMEELAKSIADVTNHAAEVSSASSDAKELCEAGKRVVAETLNGITKTSQSVGQLAETVGRLGNNSRKIGDIITVIEDIADQTNLLALNAAIEAARAGEQGRGFAVVADEVRKLAERTTKATSEIAAIIKMIQTETSQAVSAMDAGKAEAEEGLNRASEASDSIERIFSASDKVAQMVLGINAATEQQSACVQQAATNVSEIADDAKGLNNTFSGILTSSDELTRISSTLNEDCSWFHLEQNAQDVDQKIREN